MTLPGSSPPSTCCPGVEAAWNVVTSWDAFTGENFRRGGFLPQDQRYERASSFLGAANELFDSWSGVEVLADKSRRTIPEHGTQPGAFAIHDEHFDIEGHFNVPGSPQGRPVIFQAGDSDAGREFAAASADAIFSRHGTLDAGQAFYADVKARLAGYGRSRDDLLVLPAATFVLGDTDEEAAELAALVRRQQVSGADRDQVRRAAVEPGPERLRPGRAVPSFDPVVGENTIAKGRASVRMYTDPVATARQWRELAAAKQLSLREVVIEVTGRQNFIGSPATIAATIDEYVQADASDGFILVPHITPDGLAGFADKVVPLLQERGVFRTEYEGSTLARPPGPAGPQGAAARAHRRSGSVVTVTENATMVAGSQPRRPRPGQCAVGQPDRAAPPVCRAPGRGGAVSTGRRAVRGAGRPTGSAVLGRRRPTRRTRHRLRRQRLGHPSTGILADTVGRDRGATGRRRSGQTA